MHVLVKDDTTTDNIILLKKQIKEEAKEHNINHITIEIEYEKEKCESFIAAADFCIAADWLRR